MQFRLWQKGRIARIYLSDVPGIAGTAYVHQRAGNIVLTAQGQLEDDATILLVIARELGVPWPGSGPALYAAMLARCSAPRASSPGRRPVSGGGAAATTGAMPAFRGQAYGVDLNFTNIRNANPVRIEIDHREPQGLDAHLGQVENLVVERKHLELADFRINDGRILVERKTVQDFANSVQSGHLFDQAQRMGFEPDAIGVVILEGDVFGSHTGMLHSAITGAISCLSSVQRMTVINTLSLEHTAYALAKIAQHERNGLGYNLPLHKDKPTALIDAQRYVLESVTGISAGGADALLRHFGTVQAVFAASPAELQVVKGIGPKTAQRLHELSTRRYPG